MARVLFPDGTTVPSRGAAENVLADQDALCRRTRCSPPLGQKRSGRL